MSALPGRKILFLALTAGPALPSLADTSILNPILKTLETTIESAIAEANPAKASCLKRPWPFNDTSSAHL